MKRKTGDATKIDEEGVVAKHLYRHHFAAEVPCVRTTQI